MSRPLRIAATVRVHRVPWDKLSDERHDALLRFRDQVLDRQATPPALACPSQAPALARTADQR